MASGLSETALDAIAHAIVGAGESLANWWLEHPEVPREEVVDWYVGVVQGAVPAGPAPALTALVEQVLEPDDRRALERRRRGGRPAARRA